MLFNFYLFPSSEIYPEILREKQPVEQVRFHWYALSDGWYWLDVEEAQLFRYTQECFAQIEGFSAREKSAYQPYVDYPVAELWEDFIEILPAILEPVPPAIAQQLSSVENWNDWITDLLAWRNALDEKERDEIEARYSSDELSWWNERRLNTGYLLSGPNIWFWNDGTHMHIAWDNRERLIQGIPAWEATVGQRMMPVKLFLKEVLAFHHQFLTAMTKRVTDASMYWSPAVYARELSALSEEHMQRSHYLERRILELIAMRETTDWQQVLASIAYDEAHPKFVQLRTRPRRNTSTSFKDSPE